MTMKTNPRMSYQWQRQLIHRALSPVEFQRVYRDARYKWFGIFDWEQMFHEIVWWARGWVVHLKSSSYAINIIGLILIWASYESSAVYSHSRSTRKTQQVDDARYQNDWVVVMISTIANSNINARPFLAKESKVNNQRFKHCFFGIFAVPTWVSLEKVQLSLVAMGLLASKRHAICCCKESR